MVVSKTLVGIQQQLLHCDFSIIDLTEHYLENISQCQQLNAFVHVWSESALTKAREIDVKIKSGEKLGKLYGAVVSIKDNICYASHAVSAASSMLDGYISPYSATAVQRLLDEDAIIIGSTNCDEFGMGSTSTNSAYGPVRNGKDNEKIAGGSSGGAAVSIQMDCCLFAIGSDTGGSVRQPAAFCNVVGFKPSYGAISRHGLIAYASSFDQIGILSKDLNGIKTVFDIIKGKDSFDSTVVDYSIVEDSHYATKTLSIASLSPIKEKANIYVQNVLALMESKWSIHYEPFQFIDYLVPCYYILTTAEASSNLSRYDGVRYGHRSKHASSLDDLYKNSRTEGFGAEVKKRIMLGTFVLSEGYFDAYYSQAQKVRRLIRQEIEDILDEFDVIAMPVTTSEAWGIDQKVTDAVEVYLSDIFTVLANLVGMPSISIPIKIGNGGTMSVQFMVKQGNEEKLFDIVREICDI